jgi:cell division protein YceG involved in septum cleavage
MTITNGSIVKGILKNNQRDEEGFFYPLIYSYTRKGSAETLYALFTDAQYDDMDVAPMIENVVCLAANGILTIDGQEFIKDRRY